MGMAVTASLLVPTSAHAEGTDLGPRLERASLLVPTSAHAEGTDLGPRLERACLRIPNLERRTTNMIQRLEGDASVLGSLAWLQAQIERATAQGRTQLATALENRLAVRTQTLEILRQRQERLPELRQFCIDHGVDL
jgi:hypothetical protein